MYNRLSRDTEEAGMKKAATAPVVLALAMLAVWPGPVASYPAGADQAAAAATRTYLARLEKLGFAGVVLVARGDEPLFAEGFGLADREHGLCWTLATVSTVGSITKQFTAAAILALEEDGKLTVTDPIAKYFDGVPADKSGITLHHLLTHSSGLSDPDDLDDWDTIPLGDYVRRILAQPLLFGPGRGYTYANANFSLLGAIVEKLTGRGYEAFIRDRLFLPNGMYETGYVLPRWGEGRMAQGYQAGRPWGTVLDRPMLADGPAWPLRANGGIHSTATDMLRWARALLKGRVLKPASMEKLWAPHVSEGGDSYYGYGWSITKVPDGTKIVTHNGGNGIFYADLAIVPDKDLVVFLMTNVISENRSANALLRQLGMRFLTGAAYPDIPNAVDLGADALAQLAGTYTLPAGAGSFRLTVEGQGLFIEAAGRPAFAQLNSVRAPAPGRLEQLSRRMDVIIAANMKGDFRPLSKAYGGEVSQDRLKARWAEMMAESEKVRGSVLRFEVLGTARTEDRDESVIRFFCEKGNVDLTYVWDLTKDDRLLGRSDRGLTVKLRLYPSGERDFFTWDGGIRPPKKVRIETGPDGKVRLTLEGAVDQAVK
jgi:CubicO group peptidase (beta-lactamase class C family)